LAGLLVGPEFLRRYGERIAELTCETGAPLEPIPLPADPAARLAPDQALRVELAYFSGDIHPAHSGAFFAAAFSAEKLRWVHCFNAGTDHPIFARLLERGVCLTNSPGASAVPIAHSAIAGLLALARRLPLFGAAQRERHWLEAGAVEPPPDLAGQTLAIVGLGGIGGEIARLGRALGLRVAGVRRSAPDAQIAVDEWVAPARLREVLPRAHWLALACPLTDETRGWIDAEALALLPDGAHVINVARGEIVDEAALAVELRTGRIAGAYLDVFEVEPLPENSPLWSLPNVIVTPHAAALSAGNQARQAELFLANLRRYALGEPLANVV
jgi:phosphoglycerate dehydrogenase-like enzyme